MENIGSKLKNINKSLTIDNLELFLSSGVPNYLYLKFMVVICYCLMKIKLFIISYLNYFLV